MIIKKFYEIQEIIIRLEEAGFKINLEDIYYFTEQKIIHPTLYFRTMSVYACEEIPGAGRQAVGFCYLSGEYDAGDDITVFMESFRQKKSVEIILLPIDKFVEKPSLAGWRNDKSIFTRAVNSCPKPFSNTLSISCFIAHPNNNKLSISHIILSHKDLAILQNHLSNDVKAGLDSESSEDRKRRHQTRANEIWKDDPRKIRKEVAEILYYEDKGKYKVPENQPKATTIVRDLKKP